MKPTPSMFQPDLNLYENIGLSEYLIQFNPSKIKSIKIPAFNRTNKDVLLEKRTAIGNSEIVLPTVSIEMKNIEVDEEIFKVYQKENSYIQNCNNENKFLPDVDLSHVPNDQRKKVEKFLVEECEVFSKDENDMGCTESLKLKSNFKDDSSFSQPYCKIPKQLYNELKQYLENLLIKQWIKQ